MAVGRGLTRSPLNPALVHYTYSSHNAVDGPLLRNSPTRSEEWSDDGNRLVEVLSRSASQSIAVMAFRAAQASRPKGRIRLRQRARIILDTAEPRVAAGNKYRKTP